MTSPVDRRFRMYRAAPDISRISTFKGRYAFPFARMGSDECDQGYQIRRECRYDCRTRAGRCMPNTTPLRADPPVSGPVHKAGSTPAALYDIRRWPVVITRISGVYYEGVGGRKRCQDRYLSSAFGAEFLWRYRDIFPAQTF